MAQEWRKVDELLTKLIPHEHALNFVRAYYFREDEDPQFGNVPLYSGSFFDQGIQERLTGERANTFVLDDVHSLAYLGVPAQPNLVRDVAAGYVGNIASPYLAKIPADLKFEDCLDDDTYVQNLGPTSPAAALWSALRTDHCKQRGWKLGQTRVSKLLAYKRPYLIPISDRVIRRQFGLSKSDNYWDAYRDLFNNRPQLTEELASINATLELDIPNLRTLDVILWMAHGHRAMTEAGFKYWPEI